MPFRHTQPAFADERGVITDILVNEQIQHVTIITTKRDGVRGNHWHEHTIQYVYIVEGRLRMTSKLPGGSAETVVLSKGDLAWNQPTERHAMRALEDTVFMVFTRGPRGGAEFESDTFRLSADDLLEDPEAS